MRGLSLASDETIRILHAEPALITANPYRVGRGIVITAARAYAARGLPVFPCEPSGKRPLTKHGHLDASTRSDQLRHWWSRWPTANIGLPTGAASGLLVLDEDPRHGGTASLEALEGKHGSLPATATIGTGGGGRHHVLKYPAGEIIRNSAGKLGPGLDVRGEGGYIVAPPSRTTGPYEVLYKAPPADAPKWLLETLTSPPGGRGRVVGDPIAPAVVPAASTPIVEGQRNVALFQLASSMRARGHDRETIMKALEEANAGRCSPPLDAGELARIAASACRYAPGGSSAGREVRAALDAIQADFEARRWSGARGQARWKIVLAVVALARQHGELIPGGVRVRVSERQLAKLSGCSRDTVHRHLGTRLGGAVRLDNLDREPGEPGAVVLPPPPARAGRAGGAASNPGHSTSLAGGDGTCGGNGTALSQLAGLRASVAGLRWLGPGAGRAFDALLRLGGVAHKRALADALGTRTSNLTRKGAGEARGRRDAGARRRRGVRAGGLAWSPRGRAADRARRRGRPSPKRPV